MNKIMAFSAALLILSLALGACSPTSIGIQLPGGPEQGGNQADTTALLYVLIVLAGVAAVLALVSAASRR